MTYDFDPELVGSLHLIPPVDFSQLEASRAAGEQAVAFIASVLDRGGVTLTQRFADSLSEDGHRVPLRIHAPADAPAGLPVVLDMHGGGFAANSAAVSDPQAIDIVRNVGAVVVSVDYRLSPEHPYPAALEDCYSALVWIVEHAEELGVDPARLALVGQSAGGGLAAGLALLARDRKGPAIAFQYLGVPEVDDALETPSMLSYVDTPFWSRPNAILSWQFYLGELHGSKDIPLYAAPSRATVEDLVGLPPAYVSVMQYDPLRDEGIQYAAKLAQAGVPTELHLFPQTFHASFFIADADVSQREVSERSRVLRRALGIE